MKAFVQKWKTLLLALILFLALFVMAETGFQIKAFAQDRYADLQNFTKVLNLVEQYYVEEVDTKKLIYGAIKGMLRELDPHTNFMPPDIFKDFETETSGEFGGLGIEISVTNGILTIISPIEDTPAWEAGIKAGDKVIAVDGHSTKGLSLVEASQLMKGKKGSKVVLKIVRDGEDEPRDIGIVRGSVKIKSVKYTNLDDGYAYIKITSFIENTAKDLEKAIDMHIKNNKKVEGMIIDMRRNPGGLLDQAVKVSDMFLKDGTIVSTIGRNKKDKEVSSASKKGRFTDFPIIILVNEYTASASEIVSGALQDNKRALIAGQRTFGKGSVQSVVKLGDGSGLKLTVARYYTPSGVSIQAEGIKPDIEIDDVDPEAFAKSVLKSKITREKDIAGHLKGDREKENDKAQKTLDLKPKDPSNALAWWKDVGNKKDENLTTKEKLFKNDYQVYQCFSYLKAWKTLKALAR
ncbi:MAG: S41 family peptidase [Bdellovibrionales bacterium]|nr:S41 family peptidase [Bdellovibrionales bacterium]